MACFAFDCVQQQNCPFVDSFDSRLRLQMFFYFFISASLNAHQPTIHHKIFILSNNGFIVPNYIQPDYFHLGKSTSTTKTDYTNRARSFVHGPVRFSSGREFGRCSRRTQKKLVMPQTLQNVSEFSNEISYCGR